MKLPDFNTKSELIQYLIKNKKELVELKKATMKFTDHFGSHPSESNVVKSLNTHYKDDLSSGIIKRTIIANTYNWMDSHSDVHLDGVFTKTIADKKDRIFHLHDHEYKITSKVGTPIDIYEKQVAWSDIGVNYSGTTTALMMDSNISKEFNPLIFNQYLSKEINQHSVGMVYVKIELGVNNPDEKPEYAVWNKVINTIGNKEKAMEQGYFWAVSEAKLIEISAVLEGSNELTPTIDNKEKEQVIVEEKAFDYSYLVKNL